MRFSNADDTINQVVPAGGQAHGAVEVSLRTVDDLLRGDVPLVIKLDIEGYEFAALRGTSRTLSQPELRIFIVEMNDSGGKYGVSDAQAHDLLIGAGFFACSYEPFERHLVAISERSPLGEERANMIYVRDLDWLNARILDAAYQNIHRTAI